MGAARETDLSLSGQEHGVTPSDIGDVGFDASPNLATKHTVYELCLPAERRMKTILVDRVRGGRFTTFEPSVTSFTLRLTKKFRLCHAMLFCRRLHSSLGNDVQRQHLRGDVLLKGRGKYLFGSIHRVLGTGVRRQHVRFKVGHCVAMTRHTQKTSTIHEAVGTSASETIQLRRPRSTFKQHQWFTLVLVACVKRWDSQSCSCAVPWRWCWRSTLCNVDPCLFFKRLCVRKEPIWL